MAKLSGGEQESGERRLESGRFDLNAGRDFRPNGRMSSLKRHLADRPEGVGPALRGLRHTVSYVPLSEAGAWGTHLDQRPATWLKHQNSP